MLIIIIIVISICYLSLVSLVVLSFDDHCHQCFRNPFFASQLRREQRTADLKQLPHRDMREVESLNEDSLPTSLDERDRIGVASRHWQIGSTSCQAIVDAALSGIHPEPQQIVLVDLFMRQGEMAEAFTRLKAGRSNVHYCGFAENQDEINFVEVFLQDQLAEMYESGVPTPTGAKIEQEMSGDLMEPMPPHPRMNILASCCCHSAIFVFQFLAPIENRPAVCITCF